MPEETTELSNGNQLPAQENQPPASGAIETPAAEPADNDAEQDPVSAALKGIDLNTLTKDDVFLDIINHSKLFAFRLMVGAALLEQLIVKGRAESEATSESNGEVAAPAVTEDQAVS